MKKIVLFGGGTGLSQILKGLKLFPVEVSAIISVSDNGGSTGMLKEELDMPAIGDIAKVVISMADVNKDIMNMLSYRFDDRTSLENHPIKNLLLAALYDIKGNLTESTEILCKFLNIKGKILPLTEEKVELVGHLKDKKIVIGEENITNCYSVIEDLSYNKKFEVNKKVFKEVKEADLIIFSPGSLWTSIMPHLIVPEVCGEIRKSKAKKMYISNLFTQTGETDNFKVSDHVNLIEKYLGCKLDVVLSNNKKIDEKLVKKYQTEEQKDPIILDKENINANVIEDFIYEIENGSIRHDSLKTAYLIFSYLMKDSEK